MVPSRVPHSLTTTCATIVNRGSLCLPEPNPDSPTIGVLEIITSASPFGIQEAIRNWLGTTAERTCSAECCCFIMPKRYLLITGVPTLTNSALCSHLTVIQRRTVHTCDNRTSSRRILEDKFV